MQKTTGHFAIKKHNFNTFETDSKIDVLKGRARAELTCQIRNERMSKEEDDAGWSYFIEPTSLPVTLKPQKHRALKADSGRKRAL